jgi:hypothetical protein
MATAAMEQLRLQNEHLLTRLGQLENQMAASSAAASAAPPGVGMYELMQRLDAQNAALIQLVTKSTDRTKVSLIDHKSSIGKPTVFTGKDEEYFYTWSVRTRNFISSIYPDCLELLIWSLDQDDPISESDLDDMFGSSALEGERIEDLIYKVNQIYHALQGLTELEPFEIVENVELGNGAEAWRRLNRRFDPTTAGRRRNLLNMIIKPDRITDVFQVFQALEAWEGAVRRYELRRRPDGTRQKLDSDIKIAGVLSLMPTVLEEHLELNASRFKV